MTSRDFCYWLQGFFEINGRAELTADQVACVKKHLDMVFLHEIDPSPGNAAMQNALSQLHQSTGDVIVRC